MTETVESGDESALERLRERALGAAFKLGVRNVAVRAIGLIGTVVLARLLAPADFGLVALGVSVQLIGNVLSSGGLGAELIRREEPPTIAELRSVLGYQLLAAFVLSTLACLVAAALGGPADFVALVSFAIPIAVLDTPCRIVLARSLDWDLVAVSEVAGTLVFNLFAVTLVVLGYGVWGVGAAMIVEAVVTVVLLVGRGPVGIPRPSLSFRMIRPLLRFGLAYQGMALVDRGRDQAVNLVAAATGGLALLGVWAAAYRIFLSITLVLEALWRVSFPAMARMLEAGQDAKQMVDHVLGLNATAFGIPAVAVAGSAPALVPVLFGSHFDRAVAVLPWGAASLLISGPVISAGLSFIQARGDSRGMIGSYLLQAVVWVGLSAALIPLLGVEGIGIGMLAGALALAWSVRGRVRRHVSISLTHALWPPVVSGALGASLAWPVASSLNPPALGLLASLLVAEGAYLLALVALRRSDVFSLLSTVRSAMGTTLPATPRPWPRRVPS